MPTPMMRSALSAMWLPESQPVEPTPPTALGWSKLMAPLPAWVSPTGMPVVVAKARSSSLAPA